MARRTAEAKKGVANGAVAAAPHEPCAAEESAEGRRFIGVRGAAALRRYKYSAVDRSIIAPYFQPFWTRLVELIPLWVAPNCVTVSGLVLVVASFALAWRTSPALDAELAPEVMLVHAVLLFAYQTLDAVDGKQARGLGAASLSRRALRRAASAARQPARPRDALAACLGAGAQAAGGEQLTWRAAHRRGEPAPLVPWVRAPRAVPRPPRRFAPRSRREPWRSTPAPALRSSRVPRAPHADANALFPPRCDPCNRRALRPHLRCAGVHLRGHTAAEHGAGGAGRAAPRPGDMVLWRVAVLPCNLAHVPHRRDDAARDQRAQRGPCDSVPDAQLHRLARPAQVRSCCALTAPAPI